MYQGRKKPKVTQLRRVHMCVRERDRNSERERDAEVFSIFSKGTILCGKEEG